MSVLLVIKRKSTSCIFLFEGWQCGWKDIAPWKKRYNTEAVGGWAGWYCCAASSDIPLLHLIAHLNIYHAIKSQALFIADLICSRFDFVCGFADQRGYQGEESVNLLGASLYWLSWTGGDSLCSRCWSLIHWLVGWLLISGRGSALLCCPAGSHTLPDYCFLYSAMLILLWPSPFILMESNLMGCSRPQTNHRVSFIQETQAGGYKESGIWMLLMKGGLGLTKVTILDWIRWWWKFQV